MKFFTQRRYFLAAAVCFVVVFTLATLFREGPKDTAPRTVGTPAIGGPFTLVDHTGKSVSDTAFRGRFMLVFFGYTFCPDVCPTNIQTISDAMDLLGEQADMVQPLFVTIDPERDTTEVMADYVSNFHPRLVGLTGTSDQVPAAAKAYRVYYSKYYPPPASLSGEQESGDEKAGEGEENSDYFMNHSSATYMMDRDGKFITHFGHGIDSEDMAERIRKYL